ncbi:hypothetical protein NUW58_g874 [Xylaria curta]|uniref:Uncharacterized protein n=1 Tax=Xylaria curta TaxID=42375 RepID=A0ACC1PQY8_9PEZI|nr:hypothetical protein NUW58_g874 [Xylaria curta]
MTSCVSPLQQGNIRLCREAPSPVVAELVTSLSTYLKDTARASPPSQSELERLQAIINIVRHALWLTGVDKPAARRFIKQLEKKGARVSVVRGNVIHADDVATAMAACKTDDFVLGGIVQAVVSPDEALFTDMTTNAFLDAFAQWSRRQGKPTVAVGLRMVSEVGYIHENPQIESLLLRRGLVGLKEKEFLQIVGLVLCSLRREHNEVANLADSSASTVVTSFELEGAFQLITRGFEVTPAFGEDPRASPLIAAFKAKQEALQAASHGALVMVIISL